MMLQQWMLLKTITNINCFPRLPQQQYGANKQILTTLKSSEIFPLLQINNSFDIPILTDTTETFFEVCAGNH